MMMYIAPVMTPIFSLISLTQRPKKLMQDSYGTVFIIDTYNKYAKNTNVRYTFKINEHWYCIREVPLEWGKPKFPEYPLEDNFVQYKLNNTYEEAQEFVRQLKRANGKL